MIALYFKFCGSRLIRRGFNKALFRIHRGSSGKKKKETYDFKAQPTNQS